MSAFCGKGMCRFSKFILKINKWKYILRRLKEENKSINFWWITSMRLAKGWKGRFPFTQKNIYLLNFQGLPSFVETSFPLVYFALNFGRISNPFYNS